MRMFEHLIMKNTYFNFKIQTCINCLLYQQEVENSVAITIEIKQANAL